jgi:hypothetical protein
MRQRDDETTLANARGHMMGLRRARVQAQREKDEMTDRFEDVIGQVHAEMRGVRDELARLRMIDNAILALLCD